MYLYKRLQFFNTLAPYFNRIHDRARKRRSFRNVNVRRPDVDVTVTPMSKDRYEMSPWPFYGESLRVLLEASIWNRRRLG